MQDNSSPAKRRRSISFDMELPEVHSPWDKETNEAADLQVNSEEIKETRNEVDVQVESANE